MRARGEKAKQKERRKEKVVIFSKKEAAFLIKKSPSQRKSFLQF